MRRHIARKGLVSIMSSKSGNTVILAFESSADQASAAVWQEDGSHWLRRHAARHGHAAIITELARTVMSDAGLSADELTHVVAGRGPGSFTGIRVSLAAAKGFALASGAARAGISCLEALFNAVRATRPDLAESRMIATADTRRGSYFCQLFDPAGEPLSQIEDIFPDKGLGVPEAWRAAAIIGPGATDLVAAFPELDLTEITDTPPVDALQIAELAAARLKSGQTMDPLMPLYVAPAFLGPPVAAPTQS